MRRLLRGDGAGGVSLEKLELFQQNPGLLEKYLIGSEVSLEVLDLFLSRLFGSEGLFSVADAKEAVESVKSVLDSPRVEEKSGNLCEKPAGRGGEHWAVVEQLQQQVRNLTRQVSALQRQLQMQGEVSHVAASLEEIASAHDRRITETDETIQALRDEIRKVDVRSRVSDVARDLGELVEEVSQLKETERVLRQEIQAKIERLDLVVAPLTDPLDGIIARLTRELGDNVLNEEIVQVTASSPNTPPVSGQTRISTQITRRSPGSATTSGGCAWP